MKFIVFFLLVFITIATSAQTGAGQFEKCYSEFTQAKSVFIAGAFAMFGDKKGSFVEAAGTVMLQKEAVTIQRYKSVSISEIPILMKINYEAVTFDGSRVYTYDQVTDRYEDRGTWEPAGKNYSGYSMIIYSNLEATLREFNRNKDLIQFEMSADGYNLVLPQKPDQGKVVISFAENSLVPRSITRFLQPDNSVDYVLLTLGSLKYNLDFPPSFFQIRIPLDKLANALQVSSPVGQENSNRSLLAVGSQAPDWQLSNSLGNAIRLSDLRGKLVLLDFWATWCGPCVSAQPMLQRIHEAHKNVVVLGMDYNDKAEMDLNQYKARKKITYEMIAHAEQIGEQYQINALPTVYLIDQTGKIIFASLGYTEKDEQQLTLAIEKASKNLAK